MHITKHVHAIKIPFRVKTDSGILNRFVYSYVVCGEDICLIDSGVSSSEGLISDYLESIGQKLENISLLILTHSHPDHIGSAKIIKDKSGCKIAAHYGEKSWIEDVELQAKERHVPNFNFLVEGSVKVDKILEDEDLLDLGENISLKILHTPGHSKGSISLFIPGEGVLFSGDSIPIKGDLPIYDDFTESIKSIEKLKAIKGINKLLASWDDPREGDQIYHIMDEGLDYLQQIDRAIIKIADKNPMLSPSEFCKMVLKDLGLPEIAATPIVAISFQANLQALKD